MKTFIELLLRSEHESVQEKIIILKTQKEGIIAYIESHENRLSSLDLQELRIKIVQIEGGIKKLKKINGIEEEIEDGR